MGQRSTQKHFIAERARALALVYLTRRDDLIITEEGTAHDVGVDLWVTLNRKGKEGYRRFGVALKGARMAVGAGRADEVLEAALRERLRYQPFPLPVVLFFFDMDDHEGWYTWVAEPVILSDGRFELVQHGSAACRPLNTEAIDEIVEVVDRWYDAFFARAIRETPTRKRKTSTAH